MQKFVSTSCKLLYFFVHAFTACHTVTCMQSPFVHFSRRRTIHYIALHQVSVRSTRSSAYITVIRTMQ